MVPSAHALALPAARVSSDPDLIDYYTAFEALLAEARSIGDHRTHFGCLEADPGPDYCFFRAIARPRANPEAYATLARGMDRLHERVFGPEKGPFRAVIDAGCGAGGPLARVARAHPAASVLGVNLNPTQLAVARAHARELPNVTLAQGDYLSFRWPAQFDLAYFIESAFHAQDRDRLAASVASWLRPGGRLVLVDLFLSPRLASRRVAGGLFQYAPLAEWERTLARAGVDVVGFEDVSAEARRHITIRASDEEYARELVEPAVEGRPGAERLRLALIHAYKGYARLGELLDRRFMSYGILRARKRS